MDHLGHFISHCNGERFRYTEHMFSPISNPPSQFEACIEWEVPPPKTRVRVFEDHARTILSRNDSPDLGFRWSINAYRGCLHACSYCYARPTHEYLGFGAGTDFDTQLIVKPRAADLLRTAFERPSWLGERVVFSGNTDCYQPLEAHYKLTRGCLKVCSRYRNPVSIITKSAVIERDIDVLSEFLAFNGIVVTLSIPFHDGDMGRVIEPHAPSPRRRYRVIERMAAAGIPVGIQIGPVIPGLNDRQIPNILTAARDAGASWAGLGLIRLPGPVRDVFEQRLRAAMPDRTDSVMARINRARGGRDGDHTIGGRMRPVDPSWRAIADLFKLWRRRLSYGRMPDPPSPTPFRRPGAHQESMF